MCSCGAQQLAEGEPVAELDTVGVDILAEKRDLDGAVVNERLDLREDVARTTILLFAAKRRDDAERAGVVAPDGDGHPAAVGGLPSGREGGREDVEGFENLELGFAIVTSSLEQCRERAHVVGAEYDIHPGRLLEDGGFVFLCETSADRDLHALVLTFDRRENAEIAVELVVRVLANRARVDYHNVGLAALRPNITGRFERPA
jgi:hypothetical protein